MRPVQRAANLVAAGRLVVGQGGQLPAPIQDEIKEQSVKIFTLLMT